MSHVTFKGKSVALWGELPAVGSKAKNFQLVANDLSEVRLADFSGQTIILNIFPSLDTEVCANSVRKFNQAATGLKDTVVLCISKDLPFAQARFCAAEGIDNVKILSAYRYRSFQHDYGVGIADGPLQELLTRAVFVINPKGEISYMEIVPEITDEPNYAKVLEFIGA